MDKQTDRDLKKKKFGMNEDQIKKFMNLLGKLKIPPYIHFGYESKKPLPSEYYFQLYLPDNQNKMSDLLKNICGADGKINKEMLVEIINRMSLSYIKRNLPLPELFMEFKSKIFSITGITLWPNDFRLVLYSLLNSADSKLRMCLLKDFSKNNCVPLVHPTWDTDIKKSKNRVMIELLPLISSSHVITSIGFGEFSNKPSGKSTMLNTIFGTSFGNKGNSQSLYIGGGHIEMFFDVFRGGYDPVIVIDIEHDCEESIIAKVLTMTNILIIHAAEKAKIPEEYKTIPKIIVRRGIDKNGNTQGLDPNSLEIRLPVGDEIGEEIYNDIREKVLRHVINIIDDKNCKPKATRENFLKLFGNPADCSLEKEIILLSIDKFEAFIQTNKAVLATDKSLTFLPLVQVMSENKKRIKKLEQHNSTKEAANLVEENNKIILALKNKDTTKLKEGIKCFADIILSSNTSDLEIESVNRFLKRFYLNETYPFVLLFNEFSTFASDLLLVTNKGEYEEIQGKMQSIIENSPYSLILADYCPFFTSRKISFPTDSTEMKKQLEAFLANLKTQINNRSLTIESLWREFAYFYQYQKDNRKGIERIIKCYAISIAKGAPFEIIDGDNFKMPQAFLKAVFSEHINERILVVSVIGPQSSGKSTLLNFVFGCDFLTSSGRCTKGIYGSYVKIDDSHKELRKHYDAFLILDTEGLMSIQQSQVSGFDKKIGLFCLAVSQLVIINVRGDIHKDMKELLSSCAASLHELRVEKVPCPSIQIVLNQNNDQSIEHHKADINQILSEVKELQSCTNKEDPIIGLDAENVFVLPLAFDNYTIRLESKNKNVLISQPKKNFADAINDFRTTIIRTAIEHNKKNPKTGFNNLEPWLKKAKTIWKTINTFDALTSYGSIQEYKDYNKLQVAIFAKCSEKGKQFMKIWKDKIEELERIDNSKKTIEEGCSGILENFNNFKGKIEKEIEEECKLKLLNPNAQMRAGSLLLSEFAFLENDIKDGISNLKEFIEQRYSEENGNKLLHEKAIELKPKKPSANAITDEFNKIWEAYLADHDKAYNIKQKLKGIHEKLINYFSESYAMKRTDPKIEEFFTNDKYNNEAVEKIDTQWTKKDIKECFFSNTNKTFNYHEYAKKKHIEYLAIEKYLEAILYIFDIPKEYFLLECLNWVEIEKDCKADIDKGINEVRETLFNYGLRISNMMLKSIYSSKNEAGKRIISEKDKENLKKDLYPGSEKIYYDNIMYCKYLLLEKMERYKIKINLNENQDYAFIKDSHVCIHHAQAFNCSQKLKESKQVELIEKILRSDDVVNLTDKFQLIMDPNIGVNFEKIKEDIQKLVDKHVTFEGKNSNLTGALVYNIASSMKTALLKRLDKNTEEQKNLEEGKQKTTFFKSLNKCLKQLMVMLSNEGESYYFMYCVYCIWKKYAIEKLNAYEIEKNKIMQQKDIQFMHFIATINNEDEKINNANGTKFVIQRCEDVKRSTEKTMKNVVAEAVKSCHFTRRMLQSTLDREIFGKGSDARILSYLSEEGFKKEIISKLEKERELFMLALKDELKSKYTQQIVFLEDFIKWNMQLREIYPELKSNEKLEKIIGCYLKDKLLSSTSMKDNHLNDKYPEAAANIYVKLMKENMGEMHIGLKTGQTCVFKFIKAADKKKIPSLVKYEFIKNMDMKAVNYLKIASFNQFINSCITEAQSQITKLSIEKDNIKLEDYDTNDKYFSIKMKQLAIGCLEKCPMCGRFCDFDTVGHIEKTDAKTKHECSLGHFVRGYIGNHLDDNVAIVKTCEEMMAKDKVRFMGKDMEWNEFINVIPDWNFIEILNLKINEEKKIELQLRNEAAKQVWNRIGEVICKEKGLRFLPSDEYLRHINPVTQHTYYIFGVSSSRKSYFNIV